MKKLLILILLMPVFSSAQVFQAMPQRGYGPVKAFWTDSILIIPTNVTSGTNLSGGREVGKIRYNITDSSLQAYTGYQWLNAQGGGGSGWRITGNSSTSGTDFLGTTNNTSLRFRTNNTAVAVLDSNGRFGIGTNSPLYPLDIYKSANTDVVYRVKNDNAGVGASSLLMLDNGTSTGTILHTGTGYTTVDYLLPNQTSYGGNGAGGVALGAGAGATIKFYQVQSEIARFSSTGIFGVGTTTPDSLITSHLGLHAKRGVRFSGLPTGVGTKAVRIDANGTLSIADTAAAGGSGTVNSGTQYRLAYYAANGTAVSENAAITASRALISDANGVPTHSTTTTTQLQYLNGATGTTGTTTTNLVFSTSPSITTPTFATSITGSYLTASELLITDGSKNIVSAPVATYPSLTELTYVKGATSSIQTQLNGKQATITFGTGVQTALGVNIGSAGAPVLFNGALGTPSSGTLTSATGLPLTTGLTGGNWKTIYTNGSGAVVELALPTAGKVLTGNGTTSAPTWETPSGGGLTVGSTAIASGTATRLLYETSGNVLGEISGATSDGTQLTLTKPSINNVAGTYTTTATAAGTTTLTVSSTYEQYFTGVTTQTCVMPDATTLTVGMGYRIVNNSTGIVTVNKNGGTLIKAMAAGTELFVQVTDIGSAAGTYSTAYSTDLAVGTGTATNITFAAGTTSVSPINLASGTVKTTPADGDIEMNGDAMYATTDAGNRGVIPVEHFIRADATRTFTSNTSQQAIFTTPASGTLTLETGTYFFEGLIAMTSMSGTSGNGKFSLIGAGTATLGAILWQAYGNDVAAEGTAGATGGGWHVIATQTAVNVTTAATGTELAFLVKGTFEVTGAGTIIPSFAQTTAAAAVVSIGTYFKCNRVGSTSATSVGQWN